MDALLLDYNGVVVNDEPLHCEALRAVLAEEGIALDVPTYCADYVGLDDHASFREAWRRAGRPFEPAAARRLVARKAARYASLAANDLPLVPGVTRFVRLAAERWPVAIASGALRAEIALGLARAGIAGSVATIVGAEDAGVSKPDPAGFRLAATRTGAGRAVVIEDSLPGLLAARALGAGCVMLATTHPAGRLAGADRVWESFDGHDPAELEPLFKTLGAALHV